LRGVLSRFLVPDERPEVRANVTLLTLARLVSNTAYRASAPFLRTIGRSFGVSLGTMGAAVSVGEFSGLLAPVTGRFVDRHPRRAAMVVGLLGVGIAALVVASSRSVVLFAIALTFLAMSKVVFDTGLGSWVADRVPYERRGRVIGLTETSWAGSLLLGVPLFALVAVATDWRWGFAAVGLVNLALALVVRRRLAADVTHHDVSATRADRLSRRERITVGGMFFLMAAAQFSFLTFGSWLEDAHGFDEAGIGAVAFLLGASELAASSGTVRFTDRIGKRLAVAVGAGLMVPAALALALVGDSLVAGVAALMVLVLGFEFAIVSFLPLVSELRPTGRARSMGLAIGFGTAGRGAAALPATWLYEAHGFGGATVASACCAACVVVLVTRTGTG